MEMRRLCVVTKEYNVPLEINFLGICTNIMYPFEVFWRVVVETGVPVMFEFDLHDVANAYFLQLMESTKKMVEKSPLNYVGKPTLRLL